MPVHESYSASYTLRAIRGKEKGDRKDKKLLDRIYWMNRIVIKNC
jgi:hypothetical protein